MQNGTCDWYYLHSVTSDCVGRQCDPQRLSKCTQPPRTPLAHADLVQRYAQHLQLRCPSHQSHHSLPQTTQRLASFQCARLPYVSFKKGRPRRASQHQLLTEVVIPHTTTTAVL